MTPRLPRRLRLRKPITLPDGTPVVMWSGPVGPVPIFDRPLCPYCPKKATQPDGCCNECSEDDQ